MTTLFKDPTLQRAYDEFGFVKVPLLGESLTSDIAEFYASLGLKDATGTGFISSMYALGLDRRKEIRDFLIATAYPGIEPYLVERRPYLATFLVKEPKAEPLWVHQDWSSSDETNFEPVMCWLPLCDAGPDNGTVGFIERSHRYFDYLRAFPYGIADTPIHRHRAELSCDLKLIPVRAGEAVIFSNKTVHGSLANSGMDTRIACTLSLHPVNEPLFFYYIKPNGRRDTLLKYEASSDFYLEFSSSVIHELYHKGQIIDGHAYEEVPYSMEQMDWDSLEAMLTASGNLRNPSAEAQFRHLESREAPLAVSD